MESCVKENAVQKCPIKNSGLQKHFGAREFQKFKFWHLYPFTAEEVILSKDDPTSNSKSSLIDFYAIAAPFDFTIHYITDAFTTGEKIFTKPP